MIPGLDIIAAAGIMTLTAGKAPVLQCAVPKAPIINVNPVTQPIAYDFTKSSAELGSMHVNATTPYAPGTDTTTGGLRHDEPQIRLEISVGSVQHGSGPLCFWYDTVTVTIELQPKIYIAREQARDKTCRTAILAHEKKHVAVDREVINQYAQGIGKAVQSAVNAAGGIGPYSADSAAATQDMMIEHIRTAIASQELAVEQEMHRRQSQVDSYEEYQRVSAICQVSKIKKYNKYKHMKR